MKDKPATTYALLGALMSGPKHGYDILQFLEAGLGPAWRVSTSQLYALLKKLDKDGWVASAVQPQDTRPAKRVFRLLPTGKAHFLKWLNVPTARGRDLRIEFLAKLFFFKTLEVPGGGAIVRAQVARLKQMQEDLQRKRQSEEDGYRRLVYGFRIATLAGWLDWLEGEAASFVKQGS